MITKGRRLLLPEETPPTWFRWSRVALLLCFVIFILSVLAEQDWIMSGNSPPSQVFHLCMEKSAQIPGLQEWQAKALCWREAEEVSP